MNKKGIKNRCLLFSLLIYILLYRLVIYEHILKYSESITAAFMMIMLFVAIMLLGFQKNKTTKITKYVTNITITIIVIFFIISYGLGLAVGFLRNSYSLAFPAIIDNIFAPIIIMICLELFRYVIVCNNKGNKPFVFLAVTLITILELSINVRNIDFNDLASTFKVLTSTVLPIISKNIVLSYLAYNVGFIPGLIYRLVMGVYVYVMPIIPDLGPYIDSMIGIGLPLLIYLYSERTLSEYYNGIEYEVRRRTFRWSDVPALVFIVILVCLISGYFPHYLLGIGSGSMSPQIEKGDAVLVQKVKDKDDIKVGDIIVFNMRNITSVHRLIDIEKRNGTTYYITKGDANNAEDNINLTMKDIKGKVKFKIKYIGIPSVYLSEWFKKEKKG